MDDDRIVHCTISPVGGGRIEIVRYGRAGKCFLEDGARRKPLTVRQAASFAAEQRPAMIWNEGAFGGKAFDAAVRRLRAEQKS